MKAISPVADTRVVKPLRSSSTKKRIEGLNALEEYGEKKRRERGNGFTENYVPARGASPLATRQGRVHTRCRSIFE